MAKDKSSTTSTAILMSQVAEKYNEVPKKMTQKILHTFLETIETSLVKTGKVRLDRLGILAVKDRAPRVGRNPQTGVQIDIPATKKVAFRVSTTLKDAVGKNKN